jgi:hypothetical protein
MLFTLLIIVSALVWGSSVKFHRQRVGKEHILEDEDVCDSLFYFLNPLCLFSEKH